MNINVSFDYKKILQFLLQKFSIVLWVFLLVVIIAESFVIRSSVQQIMTASDNSQIASSQLIRVNFGLYDAVENNLKDNAKYLPQFEKTVNPFGVKAD